MRCPGCGHDNPADTRFCGVCGSAMALTCSVCGAQNPPTNRFCGACGTAIEGTSPAGRTERRLVTVLFADLVGFTPLAESRDAEEVREMLSVYFERSREIVERFHGSVEKFIGDAVMAWWGAVEAREDDAERAVRAALELVDMVSDLAFELAIPGLALRAGVLTGEAAVSPGNGNQGVLVGDTVNTASRLQSIAEPGTVVVSESTRTLVADAVEFRPLGAREVKGKELPVRTYRALRVTAARRGRGKHEGLEPPFTGRHEELRLLKDQLHATGREQRGRLISVVGDPGIGKSRLAWELQKYIDGIAEGIYWHQGRSPAYGDGIAFWSVGEMIRGRAGIVAESDDRAKSRLKLRTMVAEHLAIEEERVWVEPRLAALLGLEEMPPGDRNELFAALRTFFHRVSEQGTTVLVFEDFHWADPTVLEFVADLVDRSTRHPILVLTLSRSDLLERHPGWGSGRNTLSIHLAPLTDDEMQGLVTGMVPGIPLGAADTIVERAAGIPLYAVEFVRMLLGSGDLVKQGEEYVLEGDLARLAVPDTLAAVIGARLDRLDREDRSLVQDAAVLGQQFTLQGLSAIREEDPATLEHRLRRLVRQELFTVEDDPLAADRGGYRFVQSLIREVAYGRLSRSDRHVRHRRVAEYFVGLDDPELAGFVASHFLAAHETAPAGTDDLLKQGRAALIRAANRANDLRSHSQALALYRQALELAGSPAEEASILIKATTAASWGGDLEAAIELGHRSIETMEKVGDSEGCYRACSTLGYVLNSHFRSDEAVDLLQPLYEAIDDFNTPARVTLGLEMARAYMLNQVSEKSLDVANRVLPNAERIGSPGELIDGIVSKATALADVGRYMEAEALLAGAVGLADQHSLHPQALRALNNLAVIQSRLDPMNAQKTADALWERTLKFGGRAWLERARGDRADQLSGQGRFDEAREILDAIDVDHLPAYQRGLIRANRMMFDALRSPTPVSAEPLLAEIDSWGPVSDPQALQTAQWFRALAHRQSGEWERFHELASTLTMPWSIEGSLQAAIMLRDPDGVRAATDAAGEHLPPGRFGHALQKIGTGALRYLEGDQDEGVEILAGGVEAMTQVSTPMGAAAWRAMFAALVGPDHPAARQGAIDAQEWMREVGAFGLERLLAAGLPGDSVAERAG